LPAKAPGPACRNKSPEAQVLSTAVSDGEPEQEELMPIRPLLRAARHPSAAADRTADPDDALGVVISASSSRARPEPGRWSTCGTASACRTGWRRRCCLFVTAMAVGQIADDPLATRWGPVLV